MKQEKKQVEKKEQNLEAKATNNADGIHFE